MSNLLLYAQTMAILSAGNRPDLHSTHQPKLYNHKDKYKSEKEKIRAEIRKRKKDKHDSKKII